MSAQQTVFARAVSYHLPNAIPTHLERIDEFAIGKVLVYSKRPHRIMPWRRRELDFTGYSLSSLLDESSGKKVEELKTSDTFLFDVGTGTSSVEVTVDVDLDGDLEKALKVLNLGGGVDVKNDYHKKVSITADFGKITHVSSEELVGTAGRFKVNKQHPIVQRAMEHGDTLFVILSMYTAERCNISVDMSKSDEEEGKGDEKAGAAGSDEKTGGEEDVKESKSLKQVTNRSVATPIAFLAMRVGIDPSGCLKPQLNNKLVGHNIAKKKTKYELSSFVPFKRQALDSIPVPKLVATVQDDWVVINIESSAERTGTEEEEEEGGRESILPAAEEGEGGGEGGGAGSSPEHREIVQSLVVEEVATKVEVDITYAAPPQVSTPFITPSSEIPKPLGTGTGPGTANKDEPDRGAGGLTALDEHYVYSLKDFQAFNSSTYQGIMAEVDLWVRPVIGDKALHSAFLGYLQPPKLLEKLTKLSNFLQSYGDALRLQQPLPSAPDAAIGGLLATMDADCERKQDQVTSLIVITEAALEFPHHIVKGAMQLPADKRKTLLDLIKSTPYGTDKHVYLTEGPIKDPALFPMMTRMGFSLPQGSTHLIYTAPDDTEDDILAAGLILLKATAPDP